MRALRACVGILLLVGVAGCGDREPPPGTIGSPAPAWEAPTLDGEEELALADLEGEVVVLNVWATWCGPCVREMPGLETLHGRYADQGLRVLGASVDRGSSRDAVRRFVDEHDITFTILLDPDQRVADAFRTLGVPETFLLDRDGVIAHRWIGEFDPTAPESIERIEALLED